MMDCIDACGMVDDLTGFVEVAKKFEDLSIKPNDLLELYSHAHVFDNEVRPVVKVTWQDRLNMVTNKVMAIF